MSQVQERTRYTLGDLKPLTNTQYDTCKKKAMERAQDAIGDKPTRDQFKRELGKLWTVLDTIAAVVFMAALVISSVHIISHMGTLARAAYQSLEQSEVGTVIDQTSFVAIHQWLAIPLAEGSMILFLVMFGLTRRGWRRWVYLSLSSIAAVFILVANLSSGLMWFEALLAPAFTIGIGLKMEHLIAQSLSRKREIDDKYLQAIAVYESASKDATSHPTYKAMLRQEIIQALIAKSKYNVWLAESPSAFKAAAVAREMERDRWAYEDVQPMESWTPEESLQLQEGKPEAANPFGNNPHTPGDGASTLTTLPDNGIGITASANGNH